MVKNDGTNVWTYLYNAQDQMTKVLENGVVVQQNYYDGEGRRVEQAVGGVTTLYLYAGLNVLYEKNLQTGVATKHVYADGEQVAAITTAGTFFLSQDELGSTRLVTSGSSKVFSSDYVPYGVEYGATGSEEYMYAGMLYDAVTGLYYDNARFYDPSTGKFLTADPIGGGKSDPQSLNGYAYARDNPLAIVDPSGLSWNPLSWRPITWLLLGAAIGLGAISAAQFGLDPITDALDAAAVSEFVGSAVAFGASMVGLPIITLGTEDPVLGPDQFIASLTAQEFDEFYRNEPYRDNLTDIAQSRLASILGGTAEEIRIPTVPTEDGEPSSWRIYDVTTEREGLELKLGRDPIQTKQVWRDFYLIDEGQNVRYFFLDDPSEKTSPRLVDLDTLSYLGIPYTYLTWNQFVGYRGYDYYG